MENVQTENGYTAIAHEILEQMARIKLSPTQYRIIFVVWRQTYGYKRKQHDLSLSFISKATGCDKRQLQRELKELADRKVINQLITNGKGRIISFNKHYSQWIGETTIGQIDNGETDNGETIEAAIGETVKGTIGEIDNQKNYIKTNTKTTREKKTKKENPNSNLINFFCEEYKKKFENAYIPNWSRDGTIIKSFLDNGYSEDYVKKYITWFITCKDDYLDTNGRSIPLLKNRLEKYHLTFKKEQSIYPDQSNYFKGAK